MEHSIETTEFEPIPAMFAPGTVLVGKYRVDGRLGVGGTSLVLRAHDLERRRDVAIKILRADVELDTETVQRFLREARAAAALQTAHVVQVHDVGQLDGTTPYIVMELLQGLDLGHLLATRGALPVAVAADFMLQACEAIAEAHAQGIIHRDLKPTNLFVTHALDGSELVKVLDFGISKTPAGSADVALTQTAALLGTPAYMSPEQMRSPRDVDMRSDVWSLGAMLYELVEGDLPFPADSFAEQIVLVATRPHKPMATAPQLERVITRCLAKEPAKRYPTVGELAADIGAFAPGAVTLARVERIQRTLAALEPPDTTVSEPVKLIAERSRLWIAALLAVVVAAVAAIVVLSVRGDHSDPIAPPPPSPPITGAAVAPPLADAAPAITLDASQVTVETPPQDAAPPADAPPSSSPPPHGGHHHPPPAPPQKPKCDPFSNPRGC